MSDFRVLCRGLDSLIDTDSEPLELSSHDNNRIRIRTRLDTDKRPSPGTSEILSRSLTQEELPGVSSRGVLIHDLLGLAPIHLLGSKIDKENGLRWHPIKGSA